MTIRSSGLLMFFAIAGCATATRETGGVSEDVDAAVPDATGSSVVPDAASSGCSFSGVLATWSFAGEPGSETSTAAASTAVGVSASVIRRDATLTATSGAGSINASNWSTAAHLDPTKYFTFSITPPAGCALGVTSLAIDAKSSTTGPASAAAATSADGFTQTTAIATAAPSTPALSASTSNGTLEIRVYGYSASGAGGTMRVQNTLGVSGTLH